MGEIPAPAWSLLGVVLGFSLGEGARWVRERFRIRRLKRAVQNELRAILAQIEDKEDILRQAVQALQQNQVLPMVAVRAITLGYNSHIKDLYDHYLETERNCLHVIYERLRVADQHMESFHEDFQKALKDQLVNKPWEAYVGYLGDIIESYEVVRNLIRSFLNGQPDDVFHTSIRRKDS